MSASDSLIAAARECDQERDVAPNKVLRPIGAVSKEWCESQYSTELPQWIYWKVVEHIHTFVGRRGKTLLYKRNEVVQGIDKEEFDVRNKHT